MTGVDVLDKWVTNDEKNTDRQENRRGVEYDGHTQTN